MNTEKKPRCKLVGEDGNAFAIMGRVSRALKNAGLREKEAEFTQKAIKQPSYGALLSLCDEYVEIE